MQNQNGFGLIVCVCNAAVPNLDLTTVNRLDSKTLVTLNTSYLTDSYISFSLKLESRLKFCSNRLIRSSTYGKKFISDFPPCGKMVVFVTEFVIFLKTSK